MKTYFPLCEMYCYRKKPSLDFIYAFQLFLIYNLGFFMIEVYAHTQSIQNIIDMETTFYT